MFFHPAIGKQHQMEELLSMVVEELRQMGQRTTLWRLIYSSAGPIFQTVSLDADLAELDQSRRATADIRERNTAELSELSRAPVRRRLIETLVRLRRA